MFCHDTRVASETSQGGRVGRTRSGRAKASILTKGLRLVGFGGTPPELCSSPHLDNIPAAAGDQQLDNRGVSIKKLHGFVVLAEMCSLGMDLRVTSPVLSTAATQMLENIFLPLFEVTVNPASRPQLHCFLSQVKTTAALSNIMPTLRSAFRHCWQGCLTARTPAAALISCLMTMIVVVDVVLRYLAHFRGILGH